MKITKKQAKEFFVKINCDGSSKEELAREVWERMSQKEKDPYFKDLN